MKREDIIEFISKQKTSIISSVGEDGYPATRALIQPVLIEENDIYFATYTSSRKVKHYQNNSKKTTYELKDKDCPPNSVVKLCFSSDFFIEEADEWRDGCWDFIRRRKDCIFVMTTKRPERIKDCVPSDWGDGWEHVHISISIENQQMADIRLKHFLEAPVKHREVFCAPLIGPMSIGKYLDTGLIKCVNVGGEMAPTNDVRPIEFEWIKNLYLEAKERNIEFYYHQSGSMLMRDGKNIGKWNLKQQIQLAEEIQHELESNY